jgi:hypothetical protein
MNRPEEDRTWIGNEETDYAQEGMHAKWTLKNTKSDSCVLQRRSHELLRQLRRP